AVLHALVFAAQAFPVGDRSEDLRAEQTVTFRFERAVVDRFGLGHLAVRPGHDLVRRGEADADRIKVAGKSGTFVEVWSHGSFRLKGSRLQAPGSGTCDTRRSPKPEARSLLDLLQHRLRSDFYRFLLRLHQLHIQT